jgi:hypothetical protein
MESTIAAAMVGNKTSFDVLLYIKNKPANVAACALKSHQSGKRKIKYSPSIAHPKTTSRNAWT